MAKVLGIDQSYNNSGYCLIDTDTKGIIKFGTIKSDKTQTTYQRALNTALEISKLVDELSPAAINVEGLAFGIRGDATRDLAGLLFTIVNVLKIKHPALPVREHAPTSLKKRATGSGKAQKTDMINALPEHVRNEFTKAGFKKTTGLADVTDAYWLSLMPTN